LRGTEKIQENVASINASLLKKLIERKADDCPAKQLPRHVVLDL